MIHFKANYSNSVLAQMAVASLIITGLIFFNLQAIVQFYFLDQDTPAGIIINGFIVGLFALGIISVIGLLLHYRREEACLQRFISNLRQAPANPAVTINPQSLIVQRFEGMVGIHKQKAEINQSALAASMVANESTRLSLPRYISNILILSGVFGTIVSLAIALFGASNLLESERDISGMSHVIHGMSTALSTTTTAIVSYIFFGYFFQKLTDIQTHLFSVIEQVTAQYLMPRFNPQSDKIMYQLNDLLGILNQTAQSMQTAQQSMIEASQKAAELIGRYDERMASMSDDVHRITSLLCQGFRLPEQTTAEKHPSGSANGQKTSQDQRPLIKHRQVVSKTGFGEQNT